MKKQIKRKIYLLSKRQMKPIEVIQYETGVQLVLEVQDIELDPSATVTMFVRKPSGKFVFQENDISLMGNTVVIDLHNQALTEYGHPFFQIKFKKDEEVISTYSGMLTVEKSLDDSGAEESKTVLAAFEELTDEQIARIEEATQAQIELMKAEVEAKGLSVLSTIPDEYTEMYNRVNTLFNSVANAIKGTVSGSVVRVDDVSPVEHKPIVKVVCPEGVDPTTVTVSRCGKNLIPLTTFTVTPNSTTANVTEGILAVNGYLVAHRVSATGLVGKTLTISCDSKRSGEKGGGLAIEFRDVDNNRLSGVYKQNELSPRFSFTVPDNTDKIVVFFYASGNAETTGTAEYRNVLLELGNSVTDYEAYKEPTEHTPSSDGTVEGITSLSPVMTLLTDTEGVTIECEYNKDTGKVIEKLTNAVVALGGVV